MQVVFNVMTLPAVDLVSSSATRWHHLAVVQVTTALTELHSSLSISCILCWQWCVKLHLHTKGLHDARGLRRAFVKRLSHCVLAGFACWQTTSWPCIQTWTLTLTVSWSSWRWGEVTSYTAMSDKSTDHNVVLASCDARPVSHKTFCQVTAGKACCTRSVASTDVFISTCASPARTSQHGCCGAKKMQLFLKNIESLSFHIISRLSMCFPRSMLRGCVLWWLMACTSCTKLSLGPVRRSWWREPMPLCWILTSVSNTGVCGIDREDGLMFSLSSA